MALVVLLLLDAFLIGHVRAGLSDSQFGLTDRLAYDWPILTAHMILFACLLAMSAIDLEHYWVDIRFTNFVVVAGFVLHAVWTPRHSLTWPRPSDAASVASFLALVGLGITWLVLICQPHVSLENLGEVPQDAPDDSPIADNGTGRLPPSLASPSRLGGWIAAGVLLLLLLAVIAVEVYGVRIRHAARTLVPLGLFFWLIVAESTVERAADTAILEAIHAERHTVRRLVLSEFLLLLPAAILGILGFWLMSRGEDLAGRVGQTIHANIYLPGPALFRHWTPLYGLATAASGFIIAGAVGWTVRIVFTLVFGKEAFGTGDIHLMAAAGAVAGWPVVVLGFFLTCGVAVVGWLLTLPFKRSRAIPLGPWLSLSLLTVVIFYEGILRWPPIDRAIQAMDWMLHGGAVGLRIGIAL